MSADPTNTFSGTEPEESWYRETNKLMGCDDKERYKPKVKDMCERIKPRRPMVAMVLAREVMQTLVAPVKGERAPKG